MGTDRAMIVLKKVSKEFALEQVRLPPVLRDLDLAVKKGEFLCVLGPSGCGKTTLLNLIAGFIAPTSGTILCDNAAVRGPGPERGVVFQDATLFPWLTVRKNIEFGLKLKGKNSHSLRQTATRHLASIGLEDHADKYPHTLSGGMRQRVAIARVLALQPKILLLDEPFSALDANSRERLQDALLQLWSTQCRTVLYVTHSVEEAAYLADRIVILGDGGRIFADIPDTLQRPRNRCHPEFHAFKEMLRGFLADQPCCIQPQTTRRGENQ